MADSSINPSSRGIAARPEFALLAGAVLLILVALGGLLLTQTAGRQNDAWSDAIAQLRAHMANLGTQAENVVRGAEPYFAQMKGDADNARTYLDALRDGKSDMDIPAMSGFQAQLQALQQSSATLLKSYEELHGGEPAYQATAAAAEAIGAAVPGMFASYERIAERLATRGAPAGQIYVAAGQLIRLERINNLAQRLTRLDNDPQALVEQLDRETKSFIRSNRALLDGSGYLRDGEVENLATQAGQSFGNVSVAVAAILENLAAVQKLRAAAQQLSPQAAAALSDLLELDRALQNSAGGGGVASILIYGAGGLALILLALFVYATLRSARERQARAEEHDQRQQTAILGLLDEITNLADGDLTVDVTVTEDFTGAIADSINYTVDTLRRLVGTINDTSVDIAAAASSTQDTAQKMNQASERQAREIGAITNAITQTAQSLTQVSGRAEQLAQEATNSVQVAHNGAMTVGRTIQGMAALREQIQDTAKRIKRLGESSQEIGNIIEFINDIAEQTNTLALNASIQAAMAGEAGRGFAVVADEVQRLAERAGSATRQIENLIKTIQADTNEAIISMERSTSNVVSGAASAEEAGQSLTKIESTSTDLARLIQEISVATRAQSANATKIAGQMQVIREIAVQTSGSAGQTAQAVGELTTLSEKLRESVAGFKLPADISLATGVGFQSAA